MHTIGRSNVMFMNAKHCENFDFLCNRHTLLLQIFEQINFYCCFLWFHLLLPFRFFANGQNNDEHFNNDTICAILLKKLCFISKSLSIRDVSCNLFFSLFPSNAMNRINTYSWKCLFSLVIESLNTYFDWLEISYFICLQ